MISSDTAAALLRYLWNITLISSILAISLKLALRVLHSLNPRIRYLLCVVAFALSIFLPVFPTFQWIEEAPARASDRTADPSKSQTASMQREAYSNPGAQVSLAFHKIPARLPVLIWISISILLVARELVSHIRLHRVQRASEPASSSFRQQLSWAIDVQLYLNDVIGPSTIGVLRPCVVLPRSLLQQVPGDSIVRIVMHELHHVRWRDPLVNCMMRLVLAICWPVAPLWLLNGMTTSEREAAADHAAIRSENGVPIEEAAVHYAESLVKVARLLARQKRGSFAYGLEISLNNGKKLEERIVRLLRGDRAPDHAQLACGSFLLLAGIAVIPWLPVAIQFKDPVKAARAAEQSFEATKESGIKEWKYLGDGYWQDPLGNRMPPHVMSPWKYLGDGRWIDAKGNEVPISKLPSWIYLGNGKWYTPHTGDWMNNIHAEELNNNLIVDSSQ